METSGIIERSNSPWSSRINPVRKNDGSLRLCIDYRALNKRTIKDNYPIPRRNEILDPLATARYFSTLDATSGFYQIALDEETKEKTAFAWKEGLYKFTRMPFVLCNAPATFQRAMDSIFLGECSSFITPYFDDIIVFSDTYEKHIRHLKTAISKIKASGLCLNRKKCKFLKEEVKIPGNIISNIKIRPDPSKVEAIQKCNLPKTINELRSFLGLANYCREFFPKFSSIAQPLFELLKGELKEARK